MPFLLPIILFCSVLSRGAGLFVLSGAAASGEELGQEVMHLRVHQEGGGEAHAVACADLLADGIRVVVEEKTALPGQMQSHLHLE